MQNATAKAKAKAKESNSMQYKVGAMKENERETIDSNTAERSDGTWCGFESGTQCG